MNDFDFGGKPSIFQEEPLFREQVYLNGFDHTQALVKTTHILMITDGSHFNDGSGWNLSEVMRAVRANLPLFMDIKFTKASYRGYPSIGKDKDIPDLSKEDLDQYDQIWFIAVNPKNFNEMTGDEVEKVYKFMQSGGGVFATGDHDDLGAAMCGRIPRVRSMRRWWKSGDGPNNDEAAPTQTGASRFDTIADGDDQNGVPQTISPEYRYAPYHDSIRQRRYPHPVLCGPEGVITYLPDHMHEGRVEVPALNKNIPVNGTSAAEYPKRNGRRLAPEVIAKAKNHVTNREFGVIGVYDGSRVNESGLENGVGRIVVDATWHHFFNENLNQFRYGFDRVVAAMANGTQPTADDLQKASYYRPMRAYFQNIAFWLGRKENRNAVTRRCFWYVRWHNSIRMSILNLEKYGELKEPYFYLYDMGVKARDALNRVASQCETLIYTLSIVAGTELYERLFPWNELVLEDGKIEAEAATFVDTELLEIMILGGAMHAIGNAFGDDMDEKTIDSGEFEKVAFEGAMMSLDVMQYAMERDCAGLQELIRNR